MADRALAGRSEEEEEIPGGKEEDVRLRASDGARALGMVLVFVKRGSE